jgi:hypothetical protein
MGNTVKRELPSKQWTYKANKPTKNAPGRRTNFVSPKTTMEVAIGHKGIKGTRLHEEKKKRQEETTRRREARERRRRKPPPDSF